MRSIAVLSISASLSWAGLALAHMRMYNPRPFGASTLNNSPLGNNGEKTAYDFPCKQRAGVYDLDGASNTFEIGSTQILGLVGEAVHGGGSCQISLTSDLEPTDSSSWKVIHTVIGGCPASGVNGNLGGNNNANPLDPWSFEYTIPTDVPAGKYTLAWTWFNNLGNREMYMNCAPLTLTGQGGTPATFEALPDMFIANINNTPFSTSYGADLDIPNPGKNVAYHGASAPIPPLSSGTTYAMPKPSVSGTILQPAYDIGATTIIVQGPLNGVDTAWPSTTQLLPGQTPPAAAPAAPAAPAAAAAADAPGGVFITTAAAAAPITTTAPAPVDFDTRPASVAPVTSLVEPTPAPTLAPAAPAAPTAPTDSPAPAAPAAPAYSAAPSSPEPAPAPAPAPAAPKAPVAAVVPAPAAPAPAAPAPAPAPASGPAPDPTVQQVPGSACSSPGFYICLTTSFQVCASGTWSTIMAVAEGTICTKGGAQNLQIEAAPPRKRAFAFRA